MEIGENEVLTPFIRGKVQIIQSKKGYRFNIDSVLLASFVNIPDKKSKLIDLGTGSGIIPVLLSLKYKNVEMYGFEIQDTLFNQAKKNFEINKVKGKVIKGDVKKIRDYFSPESFDYVVFNPPYHIPQKPELTERSIARYEIKGKIKDFINAACYLLKNRGKAFFIFPAGRFSEIIFYVANKHLTPKRYRFVHPAIEENATHFLIEAMKGGKSGGEVVEKPFIVYQDPYKKVYTEEVEFLLEKFVEEKNG
jgi:tRNA1(Val) A37 N6-methylase TrmN6